jgi:hypothetical protein
MVDIGLFASGDRDEVKGTCENRSLSQTKNREGFEGPISGFDLTFIELGKDKDGDPFGAMAVETNDKPVSAGPSRKPTVAEIIFKHAFNELAARNPTRIRVGPHSLIAVQATELQKEFCKRYVTGEDGKETSAEAKRKAWKRALLNVFLLNQYPRETRGEIEWIWSVEEEREAWNAKAKPERDLGF